MIQRKISKRKRPNCDGGWGICNTSASTSPKFLNITLSGKEGFSTFSVEGMRIINRRLGQFGAAFTY